MEKIIKIEEIKPSYNGYLYDIQVEGNDTYVLNGIVVHNSVVEFGIPRDIPITGTQIIHMKNGKTRTLHNKRVIFIRRKRLSKFSWIDLFRTDSKGKKQQGIFVTIDKIKARPGQYYLRRAVFEGIKELPDDIIKELKLERNLIVK